jgi:hypothetical protein
MTTVSGMRSPIQRLLDRVEWHCAICGEVTCDCWQKCSCGWSHEKGQPCNNPKTSMCSSKLKDEDLIQCAAEWRESMIEDNAFGEDGSAWLMCGVICMPLQGYLAFLGLNTKMVEGFVKLPPNADYEDVQHCWLQLPDGRVLDPTADKFNRFDGFKELPPVYLGKPTEIHKEGTT